MLAVAAILAAGLAGCGDDGTTNAGPCDKTSAGYLPCNDSPEAVLNNLIVSYQRREIDEYAELLDPEFRFYFQDGDAPPSLGRDYWTAAEDSAATHGLFAADNLSEMSVSLTFGDATTGTVVRSPDPFMWIRTTAMKLVWDFRSGTTYLITGDVEDFFFREGTGEDAGRWYLYEWHDLSGFGSTDGPGDGVRRGATAAATWGGMKSLYWDGIIREED